jgi:uncharacterized protein YktA (UPF0223 family)
MSRVAVGLVVERLFGVLVLFFAEVDAFAIRIAYIYNKKIVNSKTSKIRLFRDFQHR